MVQEGDTGMKTLQRLVRGQAWCEAANSIMRQSDHLTRLIEQDVPPTGLLLVRHQIEFAIAECQEEITP